MQRKSKERQQTIDGIRTLINKYKNEKNISQAVLEEKIDDLLELMIIDMKKEIKKEIKKEK